MTEKRRVRILLAKPGLDGHDVGAKIVVRALMDAGFDVIYTGLRRTPEQIVQAACDEDVNVLGLSILSGSHIPICQRIRTLLAEHGLSDVLWLVGGNIPECDRKRLAGVGVSAVFPVGTATAMVVDYIRENVA